MSQALPRHRPGALSEMARALVSRLPNHAARWVLLAFTGGTVLSAVLQRVLLEPEQGAQRLVELNIGELFGAAAITSLLFASPRLRPALTALDLAAMVACAVTWLLPEPHAVYASMTLAGAWLLARRSADKLLLDITQVWLALSFCELWSKLAFKLVYSAIEPFEVGLMYGVGRLFYPGLRSGGLYLSARPDWSVVILEGCSSFHNLSLCALIWLCVLKIVGRSASLGAFGALAVSAALVVTINVARILVMLPSADAYHLWHDGQGSVAVALASVLAAVVPIAVHVERKPCQRSPCA